MSTAGIGNLVLRRAVSASQGRAQPLAAGAAAAASSSSSSSSPLTVNAKTFHTASSTTSTTTSTSSLASATMSAASSSSSSSMSSLLAASKTTTTTPTTPTSRSASAPPSQRAWTSFGAASGTAAAAEEYPDEAQLADTTTTTATTAAPATAEKTDPAQVLHRTRPVAPHEFPKNHVQGPYGSYLEEYTQSIDDPVAFWKRAAQEVTWFQPPETVLEYDQEKDPYNYKWFPDGQMNMCYNCLDVHVNEQNRGDQVALYYDSPLTNVQKSFTYSEMLDQVSKFAGVLQNDFGVKVDDRIVIYMPMIPHAIIAMLACCRIGAIHSVVFGGFAAKELATRILDCEPVCIVTATAGVEPTRVVPYKPLVDEALAICGPNHSVKHTVIVDRSAVVTVPVECPRGPNDWDYDTLMAKATPVPAVPLPSNHVHHILYTSGTTGLPKGIVRDTGAWAVALKWSMGAFYNMNPGEVFWAASDIGWIVGHSYIVYAPLLQGCTTVLYEGKPVGTPNAGAFWRMIQQYNIKSLFVAPTALRAIKQADPNAELVKDYDLSCFKALFLAGEHSDPDTIKFCQQALAKYGEASEPIDHWWQTELGWPGVGNAIGLGRMPLLPGACAAPVPGFDIHIVDKQGRDVPTGQLGDMAIQLPLPPGALTTLYNNHDRFQETYLKKFPGFYYDAADAAYFDKDGYIHIVGRVDDVINVAGHRLSTGAMEEALMDHKDVAECAVFAVKDDLKGELPVGLVITNRGSTIPADELERDLIRHVRDTIGPVAAFKLVAAVPALPKTRSGKILRGTMAKIANGLPYRVTPTIEDPKVLEMLEPIIRNLVSRKYSTK